MEHVAHGGMGIEVITIILLYLLMTINDHILKLTVINVAADTF